MAPKPRNYGEGAEPDAQAALPTEEPPAPEAAPGTALEMPTQEQILDLLKPRSIPFLSWAAALMDQGDFAEEEAEASGLGIVASILTAATSEDVFAAMDMYGAERLIGTEPGGRSGLLEITGAIPLASTFDEGPSCFCIVSATVSETGERIQFSCGARAVQAAIMKHMSQGWLPFKAMLVRRRKPTRAGFYPINLERGG
jgi:hypothetical protein